MILALVIAAGVGILLIPRRGQASPEDFGMTRRGQSVVPGGNYGAEAQATKPLVTAGSLSKALMDSKGRAIVGGVKQSIGQTSKKQTFTKTGNTRPMYNPAQAKAKLFGQGRLLAPKPSSNAAPAGTPAKGSYLNRTAQSKPTHVQTPSYARPPMAAKTPLMPAAQSPQKALTSPKPQLAPKASPSFTPKSKTLANVPSGARLR